MCLLYLLKRLTKDNKTDINNSKEFDAAPLQLAERSYQQVSVTAKKYTHTTVSNTTPR